MLDYTPKDAVDSKFVSRHVQQVQQPDVQSKFARKNMHLQELQHPRRDAATKEIQS
jgi:hypothetical protein